MPPTRIGRATCASGTVDSWIAWTLSDGALHVTDATNATLTGLRTPENDDWLDVALDALRIPRHALPEVVDSCGVLGAASALPGAPPIAGLLGDQQASLLGQGCVRPGNAKITFGTGGMLDLVTGEHPVVDERGSAGTVPDRDSTHRRCRHLGPRSDHVVGRHVRGVAARRPRS